MADLHDPSRDALAKAVTALVRRHGGPSAVARRVSVDRTRIHAWMKGDIGIDRLGQLAYTLDDPIVVRFGPDTTKEPPPEWARVLAATTADEVIGRLVPQELLGAAHRLLAQLADTPLPADEGALEEREAQDRAG